MEKASSPLPQHVARGSARARLMPRVVAGVVLASLAFAALSCFDFDVLKTRESAAPSVCVQTAPLKPTAYAGLLDALDGIYESDAFLEKAAEWLGGAVRVPTESFDVMGEPDVDPRWKVFGTFHEYLVTTFPQVHSTLELTKPNTWGLVYTWPGSDPSLKPILLAAHQDVVPVLPETMNQWLQPPYSGLFDGEWIWGRGSCDDKSGLIGILGAIESLLDKDFVPKRTVVLGFGFDEETGGKEGAMAIGKCLLEKYGKDSFSMLVDEGGGYNEESGITIAQPAVAEKGYLDVHVLVETTGGHSSVPPPHTGIGILSKVITTVEDHPSTPHLTRNSPIYEALHCLAEHAPDMPKPFRRAVQKSAKSDKAMRAVEQQVFRTPMIRAAASTTQAIDLIGGGVKVNALPEQAWAVINHRIAIDNSVAAVKTRLGAMLAPVARQFNLSLTAFGEEHVTCYASAGALTLSEAWNSALEPAPRTPTDPAAQPYKLLSGTIKAAFQKSAKFRASGQDIIVGPGMSTGNTDTKRYWGLTKHIFRYGHRSRTDGYNGAHTVNEALRARAFPEVIRFYTYLILNADESSSIE